MIVESFINFITGLVAGLVGVLSAAWGSTALPTGFTTTMAYIKALDAYLPVHEAVSALGILCSYFAVVWSLKWFKQLIDWLPFT